MSDAFEYENTDDDFYLDAPAALREAYNKLKNHTQEVERERDSYKGQVTQRSVDDVLSDKGFKNPARVARDLLADKVDPADSKAVTKWLEENSDDYAKAEAQPASETAAPEQQQQEQPLQTPTVSPETQNGYEAMNATTTGAAPAGHDKYQSAFAEIEKSWSAEQVRKHLIEKGL